MATSWRGSAGDGLSIRPGHIDSPDHLATRAITRIFERGVAAEHDTSARVKNRFARTFCREVRRFGMFGIRINARPVITAIVFAIRRIADPRRCPFDGTACIRGTVKIL